MMFKSAFIAILAMMTGDSLIVGVIMSAERILTKVVILDSGDCVDFFKFCILSVIELFWCVKINRAKT
jgi:hypothetical protein